MFHKGKFDLPESIRKIFCPKIAGSDCFLHSSTADLIANTLNQRLKLELTQNVGKIVSYQC